MSFLAKFFQEIFHFVRVLIFTILQLPRDLKGAFILKSIKKKLKYIEKNNLSVSDYYIKWVSITNCVFFWMKLENKKLIKRSNFM